MIIPYLGREYMLHMFHNPPRRGHYDGKRSFEAARTYVYWPNMQREFIEYCQRCIKCQFYNKRCRKPGPYPRDIPQKPWEKCSADIVGPLVRSARGYRYILVMQDQLTRTIKLANLRRPTADEVVKHFIDRILREEGTPEVILTDRGTHFVNELFKAICDHIGVTHTTTTAYRPQCNGANERSHKELHRFLSIYSEKTRPEDWDLLTKEAEWAHNTTYHSGIKRSPYEAMRGMSPGLYGLGSAIRERNKLMDQAENELGVDATDNEIIQKYFTLLDERCLQCREQVHHQLNKTQELYQKNLTKENKYYLTLEIGDKVLLENPGTAIKDKVKEIQWTFSSNKEIFTSSLQNRRS